MNDITVTVCGNVVGGVEVRQTAGGEVASFRLASTPRRYDRSEARWVDREAHYFSVSCWRELGQNVAATLLKGMPVIVEGRLRSREVSRPCGESSHVIRYVDIDADTVGVDLSRGVATFTKVKRAAVVAVEQRAMADALAAAGISPG